MRTAGTAFALSLAVGTGLTPALRNLAHRWGVLDHALTSRKIHGKPIPRLGGIAIVLAFYAPVLGLLLTDSSVGKQFYADRRQALALIVGGLLIAALGVYDDLRGAGAKAKFAVQFGAAGLCYVLGIRIDEISLPFFEHIQLGWLGLPLTLVWIAGVINAMNLIDGLDGLAGGVALVAVATNFVIALQGGQPLMLLFTAALGGAILGFLFFNFNPASIFMGDTGSMFLGFVLATASIHTHQKASTAVSLAIPIVALGIPILDTLLAIARRAARGAPLFSADRGHIHHKLLARGLSQRQAVLCIYAAGVLLGVAAVALTTANAFQALAILAGLCLTGLLVLYGLGYLRPANVGKLLKERRRNLERRECVREIARELQEAAQAADVWRSVKAAAPRLGAEGVALRLVRDDESLHFASGFGEVGRGQFRSRHSLLGERREGGHIELGWSDGRASIDRDTEIAVELLCEHVKSAARRIELRRDSPVVNNQPTRSRRTGPRRGRAVATQ